MCPMCQGPSLFWPVVQQGDLVLAWFEDDSDKSHRKGFYTFIIFCMEYLEISATIVRSVVPVTCVSTISITHQI